MKVIKRGTDKSSGTESNINASTSTLSSSFKPLNAQNHKGKRPQVSDRPSSPAKSAEGAKKTKKKASGGDESWPFASITPQDLENEIRERAFFIYLQRGTEGDPLSDWLQAEAEIKRKYGIGT